MRRIILAIIFSISIFSAKAQSRVAIVNLMDTSLIHLNFGLTAKSNKTEKFQCQLDPRDYVNQAMEDFLSGKFSLEFIAMPVSQASKQGEKFNYKSWVEGHQTQYKLVIFIENRPWKDPLFNKELSSNGLMTTVNALNHTAEVYSTIYFTAYRTSKVKTLLYDKSAWFYTRTLKDYQFLEQKDKINPDMLPLIRTKLAGLMDSRMEHFLVSSGLLSQFEYDNIVLQKRNRQN